MPERYQREIEEILQQAKCSTPKKELERCKRTPPLATFALLGAFVANQLHLTSKRLMAIGIVLLLVAIGVSAIFPGFLGPFAWLVLILFIGGYALSFPRLGLNSEKRWRGRPIEEQSPAWREVTWERFQRWLRG